MAGRVRSISTDRRQYLTTGWEMCSLPVGACTSPQTLEQHQPQWIAFCAPGTVASGLRAAKQWSLDDAARRFDAEEWWFRTRFVAPHDSDSAQCVIGFDGLATLAEAWLDRDTNVLKYKIVYTGLSGPATAAHAARHDPCRQVPHIAAGPGDIGLLMLTSNASCFGAAFLAALRIGAGRAQLHPGRPRTVRRAGARHRPKRARPEVRRHGSTGFTVLGRPDASHEEATAIHHEEVADDMITKANAAPFPARRHRVQRGPSRTVAVGVRMARTRHRYCCGLGVA